MISQDILKEQIEQYIKFIFSSNLILSELEEYNAMANIRHLAKAKQLLDRFAGFYNKLSYEIHNASLKNKNKIISFDLEKFAFDKIKWSELTNTFFACIDVRLLDMLKFLSLKFNALNIVLKIELAYSFTTKKNRFLEGHKNFKAVDLSFNGFHSNKYLITDLLTKENFNFYSCVFTDYLHLGISNKHRFIHEINSLKPNAHHCFENFI